MFDFLNDHSYLDIFINIITVFIIVYYIYTFIKEMETENDFNKKNITSYSDLDDFNTMYQDTELCKHFTSLNDREKEYFYHIVNAQRIKYKNEQPRVSKQLNNIKTQLVYNVIITLLIKQKLGAAIDSMKHNTLLNFMNSKI